MKIIVIYNSETGFTKRYAEWIAEASGADCIEYSVAKDKSMDDYDAIVFGGWASAGGITKLKWFKDNIDSWTGKKLIVFCVGASPIDNPDIELALKKNFTESEYDRVNVFYCPGGLNYEKMSFKSKFLMKMFVKTLSLKKNKTEQEKEMVKIVSNSYDISDIKHIEPVLECLKD